MAKPDPLFNNLTKHIDATWFRLRDFHYPFAGKDFKDLKNLCRIFQIWGVMALWDAFMASDSEWVQKSGRSINAFGKCVPWLVDVPGWKAQAKKYEEQLAGAYPADVIELFKGSNEPR